MFRIWRGKDQLRHRSGRDMKGTLVNAAVVFLGAGLGLYLRRGFTTRYQETVMQGLGLVVLLIGFEMALKTTNVLLLIISLVVGGLVGEWLQIDQRLNRFGLWLSAQNKGSDNDLGQGFVAASLIYCVGAMAIVGAIQDGLSGDSSTLYAKSMLDGISAIVLATTLGAGVMLSSVSILIYQGSISLLASQLSGVVTDVVLREITAVGGLLIVAIGLSLLEIKKIKIANLLPSMIVIVIISNFIK